jgi:hypothetical protein
MNLMNASATSVALNSFGSAISQTIPINRHIAVITISFPPAFGSGPTKSIAIDSKALVGTGIILAIPAGFLVGYFDRWHMMQA